MGMDDGQSWVSLKQAAARLGLSEKTIRRRVAAGRLEGRKLSTPTGPAWLIRVGDAPPTLPREGVGTGTDLPTPPGLVEALALIERQQQQIAELSGRVGYLTAQNELLSRQAPMIEAPGEAPNADTTGWLSRDPEPIPDPKAASRPAVKPWWRFWGR